MKSITFLLPRTGEIPIGGFKVVYEYANRLVKDGYSVNIVYGIISRPLSNPVIRSGYYFLRFFRWLKYYILKNYLPNSWFETDEKINHLLRYSLSEKRIPKTDLYVATSWSTSVWLNSYNVVPQNKFYLIQAFEDWNTSREIILKTWQMKMRKIVISPWLQEIANSLNEETVLIENGLNQESFFITEHIEAKNKYSVTMMWHDNPLKGCSIGIEAFNLVKKVIPEFMVTLFGVPNCPSNLPPWIKYYQKPPKDLHRKLYNESAIFVGTSYSEGWGLTVGEAMLCGCAVACTDNQGYGVVAHDNETALLSEVGDANALANNIIRLINDDDLRIRIASSGNELIKQYTWERAYSKFLSVINS